MTPDDQLAYDHLKAYAWALGFHAEIHRGFDKTMQPPGREAACWYLQPSIKQSGEATRRTILKFSTAAEIYDWLLEYKRTTESPK
jgi:hypothetical protein